MRPNNCVLMEDLDATIEQNSIIVDAQFVFTGSVQAVFSAADAEGALTLQGSNEPREALSAGAEPQEWVDIPDADVAVASGAAALISVAQLNYRWLKLNWDPSGGAAGTINAYGNFIGF